MTCVCQSMARFHYEGTTAQVNGLSVLWEFFFFDFFFFARAILVGGGGPQSEGGEHSKRKCNLPFPLTPLAYFCIRGVFISPVLFCLFFRFFSFLFVGQRLFFC